jgi:glutathione S-transferase
MKLYYAPASCSLAAHIALREAGLDFELVRVDIRKKTFAGGDFHAVNPLGYVPVLELADGTRLTEVPAVLQFIADRNPECDLAPPYGTLERYQLQSWLAFINSEIHKTWGPLWHKDLPEDQRAKTVERLASRFDHVTRALDGRPFLLGERFTVADAYLWVVLNWAGYTHVDLSPWPALQAFHQRVAARPAVHEALVAEHLIKQ